MVDEFDPDLEDDYPSDSLEKIRASLNLGPAPIHQ